MINKYLGIECLLKTYEARSFSKFLKERGDDEEINEGDEWKLNLKENDGEVPPPPFKLVKTWFKPEDMLNITESYSLESLYDNQENPKLDMLTIDLKEGISLNVVETIKTLEKKLKEWYVN